MVKRTITLTTILLTITMIVSLIVVLNKSSLAADDDIYSGNCGTCSWVIDSEGVLSISPIEGDSGVLESHKGYATHWPWNSETSLIKKVVINEGVKTNTGCDRMFANFYNCSEIDLINLDTSNATSMCQMFDNCYRLETIDFSNFNTSNVTDMSSMFYECRIITSLDLSSFDTSKVTSMSQMFYHCFQLIELDISSFAPTDIISTSYMFFSCYALNDIDLSGFNTSKLRLMNAMFNRCYALQTVNLSSFDTSNVETMEFLFCDCKNIKTLDLSNFDTSKVSNMNNMFSGCALSTLILGEQFSFKGNDINDESKQAILPQNAPGYTGKWYRNDSAYGPYTAEEFRDNYDGSTMHGTWLQQKISYTVSYSYTGVVPTGASELPEDETHEWGESVTLADTPRAPGYTFSGWNKSNPFVMPRNNLEITGSFTAKTNTPYKVEHYFETVEGNFILHQTDNLTGTTDTNVTAMIKTYVGMSYNDSIEGTKISGSISGDGSLTLKVYYTRNYYTVTYSYIGETPQGASELPETQSYKFGERVIIADEATAPGYSFSGWNSNNFDMPPNNVEIVGSFISNNNTIYKVEHYLEDLMNDTYILDDTISLRGETDTIVTAREKVYEGFTFDTSIEGTKLSGNVNGDGSLILKLYYKRNSFKVTYTYTGMVPAGASELPKEKEYKYGEQVLIEKSATAPGYVFSGWNSNDFIMPANDIEITGSFIQNSNNYNDSDEQTEIIENISNNAEEIKTDIIDLNKTIYNPQTDDIVPKYIIYSFAGIIVLIIVIRLGTKYSKKMKKIQF